VFYRRMEVYTHLPTNSQEKRVLRMRELRMPRESFFNVAETYIARSACLSNL
jgi:hypothetical protein